MSNRTVFKNLKESVHQEPIKKREIDQDSQEVPHTFKKVIKNKLLSSQEEDNSEEEDEDEDEEEIESSN